MHKVQSILDVIRDRLEPLKTDQVVQRIEPSSAQQPSKFPHLIYSMGTEDVSSEMNQSVQNRTLIVNIDILVDSKDTDLDRKTLVVREAVEKAILIDFNLALPFVIDVKFSGQQLPDYFGDATTYAGGTRISISVRYRTDPNNPSV